MKKLLMIGMLAFAGLSANAKVVLPDIISDGMILQRNSETGLWGKAEPGAVVTIRPGWTEEEIVVKTDATGKWRTIVETPDAGGPYNIEFDDGEKVVVDNVLVGEVWLCSGQSNMEMPMKGFQTQPVEGAIEHIISARPETPIRICHVSRAASDTPAEECKVRWMENTPENVAGTSATAYFFAKKLQQILDIPVGIIVSSWGGTPIRAWLDKKTFSALSEEFAVQPESWAKSTTLFNGMILPLTSYNVRGFLWYQGESDIPYNKLYRQALPAYVSMMRGYWKDGNKPFYYVQLAPYWYGDPDATQAAEMREAQMLCLDIIPNSGMATTLDIGDYGCIHPAQKEQVGNRLAYLALSGTYGMKGFEAEPPVYDSWSVENGRILVKFKVGPQGIAPRDHVLEGFEVAGEDHVFHPATAKVYGKDARAVEVFCDEVENPVAVRYGFHNVAEATLYNCFGIPASPFRTDMDSYEPDGKGELK